MKKFARFLFETDFGPFIAWWAVAGTFFGLLIVLEVLGLTAVANGAGQLEFKVEYRMAQSRAITALASTAGRTARRSAFPSKSTRKTERWWATILSLSAIRFQTPNSSEPSSRRTMRHGREIARGEGTDEMNARKTVDKVETEETK